MFLRPGACNHPALEVPSAVLGERSVQFPRTGRFIVPKNAHTGHNLCHIASGVTMRSGRVCQWASPARERARKCTCEPSAQRLSSLVRQRSLLRVQAHDIQHAVILPHICEAMRRHVGPKMLSPLIARSLNMVHHDVLHAVPVDRAQHEQLVTGRPP